MAQAPAVRRVLCIVRYALPAPCPRALPCVLFAVCFHVIRHTFCLPAIASPPLHGVHPVSHQGQVVH